jgi:hypothetical protein
MGITAEHDLARIMATPPAGWGPAVRGTSSHVPGVLAFQPARRCSDGCCFVRRSSRPSSAASAGRDAWPVLPASLPKGDQRSRFQAAASGARPAQPVPGVGPGQGYLASGVAAVTSGISDG